MQTPPPPEDKESRIHRGIKWTRVGHHYKAWVHIHGTHHQTGQPIQRDHLLFERTVKASVTFDRVLERWGRRMVEKALAEVKRRATSSYTWDKGWRVAPVDGLPWEIHLISNERAYLAAIEGAKASDA